MDVEGLDAKARRDFHQGAVSSQLDYPWTENLSASLSLDGQLHDFWMTVKRPR